MPGVLIKSLGMAVFIAAAPKERSSTTRSCLLRATARLDHAVHLVLQCNTAHILLNPQVGEVQGGMYW